MHSLIIKIRGGSMGKFSIGEVIEQAVQTEKLGNKFYTAMAKKFKKNNELKKLFETLASQELKHEKTFSELKNKTRDEEPAGWDEVSQYLRAIVDSEFFLGKGKSLSALESIKTAVDAINFALGFERETLLYYHTLREGTKEKKVIDTIINEEKRHIVWLNDLRRSFV
jgi:rubrerythrin